MELSEKEIDNFVARLSYYFDELLSIRNDILDNVLKNKNNTINYNRAYIFMLGVLNIGEILSGINYSGGKYYIYSIDLPNNIKYIRYYKTDRLLEIYLKCYHLVMELFYLMKDVLGVEFHGSKES